MIENERSSAIHTDESVEEKISLSDRFGLWIGFHKLSQSDYLKIVETYCNHYKIKYDNIVFVSNEGEIASILANGFAEQLGAKNMNALKGGIQQLIYENYDLYKK